MGMPMGTSVGDFFNQLSQSYDDTIKRTIPPYQEMFEAVVGYAFLPSDAPWNILELGCGTGNLSVFISSMFPQARMTLVDLSPEMLAQAALKLEGETERLTFVEGGFMQVDLPEAAFDVVVSSVALHHLLDTEKPGMYQRIFRWLKPGGLLRIADEVKTLPVDESMVKNLARWMAWAREQGATSEELAMWIEHGEKYDHYASLAEHFQWLAEAGFTEIDCYWKRVLWAVFGAKKPL